MSALTTIGTENGLIVSTNGGEQATFTFEDQGDLIVRNPIRGTEGKVFVINDGKLFLNFGEGFVNGVEIQGKVQLNNATINSLTDLPDAPAGVNTFDIVIDESGNLYKKD